MLRPPSSDDPSAPASQPAGGAKDARTARLAEEYRRLAREFAFHPVINIIPLGEYPPETYQVEFRVRTVTFEKARRKLHFVDNVALVLALGAAYPDSPPTVHPPEGLFLPNADDDRIQIDGAWHAGDWLADLLPRLGEMLAYRTYDPDSVLNADALNWQEANVGVLPTDKSGDFSAAAGGSPAERLEHYAAARIAEVRRVLESTCQRLADGEIDPDGVRDTAAQAKYVLLPLLQDAGDPAITASAKELTAWVETLALSLPGWYELRERRARLAASQRAMDGIDAAAKTLNDELAKLAAMFTGKLASKPGKALAQIPTAEVLATQVPRLTAAVFAAQRQETQAHGALADFADFDASHPPLPPVPDKRLLPTPRPRRPMVRPWENYSSNASRRSSPIASNSRHAPGPALEQMVDLLRGARAEGNASNDCPIGATISTSSSPPRRSPAKCLSRGRRACRRFSSNRWVRYTGRINSSRR